MGGGGTREESEGRAACVLTVAGASSAWYGKMYARSSANFACALILFATMFRSETETPFARSRLGMIDDTFQTHQGDSAHAQY